MRIVEPLDGAMPLFLDGQEAAIDCLVAAPPGRDVRIGGARAAFADGRYGAKVPLSHFKNEICFEDRTGGERAQVTVYRLRAAEKRFRLSVDDNIWFLQDIALKGYQSLFENPYLALYRDLHRRYGVKVHMNVYLECPERGGFHLSQMPNRHRDEWLENRDWLHLSFHARANLPDKPYESAGYGQVRADCEAVQREIERFAGPVGPVTTLHWAEATPEGIRALYDCGVRALLGDMALDDAGRPAICYSASPEQFAAVRRHCFYRDPRSRMIFFPCDAVLNALSPAEIGPALDAMADAWPGRGFVDILMHEQYFYPDYENHLPDYRQRLEAGICWCLERGYRGGFVEEIIDFNASF